MPKPARDPRYLAAIRRMPCIVGTGCRGPVEAAHTGPHGLGQKSSDYSALPMCREHHRTGNDSYHNLGPHKFEERHGLDLQECVRWHQGRPRITIEDGLFIGHVHGHGFTLGAVSEGLECAVSRVLHAWSMPFSQRWSQRL